MASGDLPHVADDAIGESAATNGGVLCPRCGSGRFAGSSGRAFCKAKSIRSSATFPGVAANAGHTF